MVYEEEAKLNALTKEERGALREETLEVRPIQVVFPEDRRYHCLMRISAKMS
jgi:hypothetical protein